MKKDNSTIEKKVYLRRLGLKRLAESGERPCVMETHGGFGGVFRRVYHEIERGVVIEKDPARACFLAMQRPHWSVYCADSSKVLPWGAGVQLPVILDVDPYGDPWPTISGFFQADDRPTPPHMIVVVNDGLRQSARIGGAWSTSTLGDIVKEFGNDIAPLYLQVCRKLMDTAVAVAGYSVKNFEGYYCGKNGAMTHYIAELAR